MYHMLKVAISCVVEVADNTNSHYNTANTNHIATKCTDTNVNGTTKA